MNINIGDTFTYWTIKEKAISGTSGASRWLCTCKCGEEKIVYANGLIAGASHSCGCYRKEKRTSHGLAGTKFYYKYKEMKARCERVTNVSYPYYGAKGIKCEWKSFLEFKNDMYESFLLSVRLFGIRDTTIDRIESKGNYRKENCRWSTRMAQQSNRTDNKLLEYDGMIMTMKQWSRELGFNYRYMAKRLNPKLTKKIWTVKEAFETPFIKIKSLRPRKNMI